MAKFSGKIILLGFPPGAKACQKGQARLKCATTRKKKLTHPGVLPASRSRVPKAGGTDKRKGGGGRLF